MKTTKKKIEIMQAFEDGKKIECRSSGLEWKEWILLQEPTWNWAECDYRVKEEPPKQRMINLQLMEWLAKGKGLSRYTYSTACFTYFIVCESDLGHEVSQNVKIRSWDTDEWIEPTVDVYERDCKGGKV